VIPLNNIQFKGDGPEQYTTRQLVSHEMIGKVLELRHSVFCEKLGIIEARDQRESLEYDEYDAHATHFGTYDHGGRLVATVRMIRGGLLPLPIERLFKPEERYSHIFAEPERVWEVSRLCRIDGSDNDTLLSAYVYKAAFLYARTRGADYLVAAMRRALPRLHKAIPINWVQIGPPAEHFGIRYPYACSMLTVSGDIQLHNPVLYSQLARAASLPVEA
jgi:N-acyl-L-homoserine lactone synthetase